MFPTPGQMRAHEAGCLAGPEAASTALDEAGLGIARALRVHFPSPGTLWLFLGTGHNAGDAIVAALHLRELGWQIRWVRADPEAPTADLTARHLARLQSLVPADAPCDPRFPGWNMPRPWVILDGICGIGARLPLRGRLAESVQAMNDLRAGFGMKTVAIDLPSGLDGSDGTASAPCVTADLTVTIAAVKRGLVFNDRQVGRLVLVPVPSIPPLAMPGAPEECLLTSELIGPWMPPRPHDLHKGSAGRIAIIAGSPGMTGAAVLAALGALHGGAGLVTIFTQGAVASEVATRCPPEVMVRALPPEGLAGFPAGEFDAIAVGPGCGRWLDASLAGFVRHCPVPLVIDADALNGLARHGGGGHPLPLAKPPAARILTPHPGEFARLAPEWAALPRQEAAPRFADHHPGITLLLKGPRTIVARHGRPVAYNQSGTTGLASGGSGDVLAGLTAALLPRLPDSWQAACAAAWLHGRAAELTDTHGNESPESLCASTAARWLGAAFQSLVQRDP